MIADLMIAVLQSQAITCQLKLLCKTDVFPFSLKYFCICEKIYNEVFLGSALLHGLLFHYTDLKVAASYMQGHKYRGLVETEDTKIN